MHRSLLILLFSALLITGGCGGGPSTGDMSRKASLTEDQALAKAKQAVQQNDSFADTAEYAIVPNGVSGWTVTVTTGQGESRIIMLDDLGEVVRYQGG